VEALPALRAEARLEREAIGGVGVGFGGPGDTPRGRIERSYQIEGWEAFPLADWIREDLGIPTAVVHNDADTAGIAESHLGAGRGLSPLLYMTVGSGIGGGPSLHHPPYSGFSSGAGQTAPPIVPRSAAPDT